MGSVLFGQEQQRTASSPFLEISRSRCETESQCLTRFNKTKFMKTLFALNVSVEWNLYQHCGHHDCFIRSVESVLYQDCGHHDCFAYVPSRAGWTEHWCGGYTVWTAIRAPLAGIWRAGKHLRPLGWTWQRNVASSYWWWISGSGVSGVPGNGISLRSIRERPEESRRLTVDIARAEGRCWEDIGW